MAEKKQENPMKNIIISKITLNIGAGRDEGKIKKGLKLLKKISGLNPVETKTQKRVQTWSLRPGLTVGCKVTIRKNTNELLKRLLSAKEFVLSKKMFDNSANFSFGIPEYIDIEGIEYDPELKILGLEVAVTLERKGYRIKKRKIKNKKVGKKHAVTKEEAIKHIEKEFGVKFKEDMKDDNE